MIRTFIRLDEHDHAAAQAAARAAGISLAEFILRAIRQALPARGNRPWMKYSGLVQTGDSRSSRSIDATVYGR
jgi:hypothetical protein